MQVCKPPWNRHKWHEIEYATEFGLHSLSWQEAPNPSAFAYLHTLFRGGEAKGERE